MLSQPTSNPIVTVFVASEGAASERRFDKSITIERLKERLEPITGVPAATMKISLYTSTDQLVGSMDDDEKMLGYYPVEDFMRLQVTDLNPRRRRNEFSDVSQVEKFEITDAEYDKRTDSVRAFLKRNKRGKFAEQPDSPTEPERPETPPAMKPGDRCEVAPEANTEVVGQSMRKRGTVRFVGNVEFKPGFWVGVEYDEPLGKHDGSVQGVKYFSCPNKHGVLVRPERVTVGDFPEEDLFASDDEM
ncbi:CAP Gly-rich domain-containing protein [Fimicolochytrium jonesii]|uniref:CAP Gly-rich domain-containing protein n=1 Tax=Fimicolochytrium jonesii TaxID=1396493 RepID=UPI0022FE3084|nr:CAP Gly-rich domain-containing protein [Fimicolochytrium jonesii]KAI8816689.1 CAP Gly-rich domain-containing protein [Fimicolochytrium jonesii]